MPGLAAKPTLDLQLSVSALEPRAEDLKRRLVARHSQDRLAYIEGKHEFVAALEARAVEWARDRG